METKQFFSIQQIGTTLNNMKSFFNQLCHSPISRRAAVMLVALTWSSLTVQGGPTLYQGETTISTIQGTSSGRIMAYMSVSGGTIIGFDSSGNPSSIGSAYAKGTNWLVQGKFGINGMVPENKGRLIYKQASTNEGMAFVVVGATNIYVYHLRYLELTTVGNETNGYRAFATKAIAFDNKVESLTQTNTFKLAEGSELVIHDGRIKIGDRYISPDYKLGGREVSELEFSVGNPTNSAPATPKP